MNYYQVLTATKNKTDKLLTYACDRKLGRYQIVEVPVRRQACMGLVINRVPASSLDTELLKKCRPIAEISPYCLPNGLVKAVLRLRQASALSLSGAARLLLSNAALNAGRQADETGFRAALQPLEPALNADQKAVYGRIADNQTSQPQLILGINGSGKTRIYAELIS